MLAQRSPARSQMSVNIDDGGSSSLSELGDMLDEHQALEPGSEDEEIDPRDNDTEASTERIDPSPMKARDAPAPMGLEQLADAAAIEQIQEFDAGENIDMVAAAPPISDVESIDDVPFSQPPPTLGENPRNGSPGKRKRSSSLSELGDDFDDQRLPARKRSASAKRLSPRIDMREEAMAVTESAIKEQGGRVEEEDAAEELSEDEEEEAGREELPEEQPPVTDLGQDADDVGEDGIDARQSSPSDALEKPAGVDTGNAGVPKVEEAEGEDEAEAVAKNEDEIVKKRAAMEGLKPIENLFAIFRDKLFDERLEQLSLEIESLQQPNTQHPDFLAKRRCIDERRDRKIALEETAYRYKQGALERKAIAERAISHSQYMQEVREIRESAMDQANAYFSRLQRERRQWKSRESHYIYQFNPKRSQQLNNQKAYNKEVSLLSGLARHQGFPAAPELAAASAVDIENDLRRIKSQRPQPISYATQLVNDEMAGEVNFLEKNPWARPMAALASTPGSAIPPVANGGFGNFFGQPSTTPRALWNGVNGVQATPIPMGGIGDSAGNGSTINGTDVQGVENASAQPPSQKISPQISLHDPAAGDRSSETVRPQPSAPQDDTSDGVQEYQPDREMNSGPPTYPSKNNDVRPQSTHLHLPGLEHTQTADFSPPPPKMVQSLSMT